MRGCADAAARWRKTGTGGPSGMKEGSKFKIGNQQYRIVGTKGHWTISDRYIEMLVYEAACADCGRTFRYPTTKTNLRNKQLNRRCPRCKSPGIPVAAAKSRNKRPRKRAARPVERIERHPASRRSPDLSYLD
jgi:DNA-directed RNA polymerase subunit RPC12/RpoP